MSFALVFSGQGHQHAAMLPWLADDGLVRATTTRLGVADWREALADPAWSVRNANAQPLLTGLGLAAWQQVAAVSDEVPAAVAGYSVGELAAFSAAGVMPSDTACALAPERARVMDQCGDRLPGGLVAINGLAGAPLDQLCHDTGVAVAIRNGIDSVILGGPRAALDSAEWQAARLGAQVTRLRVGVASHTPWMQQAADQFGRILDAHPFRAPRVALFSNMGDRVRDATDARQVLAAQIANTVRWDECMEHIASRQVGCVLEVGPGQALARMWNQRFPNIPARACDDFRSVEAIAAWLRRHADR